MAMTGYRSRLDISSVPLSGVNRLSGVGLHASPVVRTAGAFSMTRRGLGTQHRSEERRVVPTGGATSTSSPSVERRRIELPLARRAELRARVEIT